MSEKIAHYIENRLYEWAEWYRRGNSEGLGFLPTSIIYRLMKEGIVHCNPGLRPLPTHEAAEEIENLVREMTVEHFDWALALRCYYFSKQSIREHGKKLGLSHSTFGKNLALAQAWLEGRLEATPARLKYNR